MPTSCHHFARWRLQGLGRLWQTAGALLCVLFILQPISRWFHGFVDWEIINPGSNNLGWYRASLHEWSFSWIWPSAWLILWAMRRDMIRSWLLLWLLTLIALGLPKTSLWEAGFLTDEERWLIGLSGWYGAVAKYFVVTAMAVAAARWPLLLIPGIPLSAFWIFI